MRQTSRAVALLLAVESAQAQAQTAQVPAIGGANFYFTTAFYPDSSDANGASVTMQLNSRTAGYVMQQQVFGATVANSVMALATNNYQKAIAKDNTYAAAVAEPGSSCMQCIGAGMVWCSRTYAYLETAPGAVGAEVQSDYQFAIVTAGAGLMSEQITTSLATNELTGQTGASKDQGSCCNSWTDFNAFVGTQAATAIPTQAANTDAGTSTGVIMVEASCVALKAEAAINAGAWGKQKIDDSITPYTSWWCSNGLYKKLTKASNVASVVASQLNAQQIVGNGINKRQELAMVGCPQKSLWCGTVTAAKIITTLTDSTTNPVTLTVTSALTTADKCTWVASSMLAAPTFKFGKGAGSGITTTNWQIHAMEFTATVAGTAWVAANGVLETASTNADIGLGFHDATAAVTAGTFIPQFDMPADQFATLRTWYGEASVKGALDPLADLPAAWLTPGQAPVENTTNASLLLASVPYTEQLGNVVNVPFSKQSTSSSASVAVGDTNYGTYDSSSIKFDLRQARYFPAQVAQTSHAQGTAQDKLYTDAKNSYATAKTAWDNYVAILEKNAKTDAFAALFSPPKAPTVPPLPSLPWLPAPYAGYVKATPKELSYYNKASTDQVYTTSGITTNPTAQQFWTNLTAAQTVGGWGSFTAQVLRFRNAWGKSFGTIGYSGASANTMSAVWNYKWTCSAVVTGPGATPCDQTYPGTLSGNTGTDSVVNTTTNLVSVVSLWSTASNDASGAYAAFLFTNQSFTLTWTPGAWSGSLVALEAIAAPVAATAAKGLSGVAGAQALAATSAAALAVAAALY